MVRDCYTEQSDALAESFLVLFLQIPVFLLCVTALGYYGFSLYAAIAFFRSPSQEQPEAFTPAVTVLKPLCGLDWQGYQGLASFCQQDYPLYQLVFCVQDANDASVAVVERLKEDFTHLQIDLVISDQRLGFNPKINNLAHGFSQAKYDILVLSDSDIQVTSDYLRRIMEPFQQESVGVVTCLYRSIAEGWLAGFEALDIATQFLPKVLTARRLQGMDFAMGSTIAIRRETLEKIGGFARVANHLADDYQLGHLSAQMGYQVVLSPYVVEHRLGHVSWSEAIARQSRWQKCVRVERFWGYVGLVFTQGTVLSTLFLGLTQGSILGVTVFLTLWLARYLTVYVTAIALFQDRVAKEFFWWTPLRDFLSFGIWCYSFRGDRVTWRGKTFQLLPNGKLNPL